MDAELAAGPTMGNSSLVSVRDGKVEKSGVLDTDGDVIRLGLLFGRFE